MVSKKHWDKVTTGLATIMKNITERETIEMCGVSFSVLPGVFSPIYSSDTDWFAKQIIPLIKNKNFLEIGAGTGVISCLAGLNGATHVVATDINPKATENTRLNAKLHSLNISIREGSLFDPIKEEETFDIIFWNHPFNYTDENLQQNDPIVRSLFDTNYQFLKGFFHQAKKHLSERGRLILGSSNMARVQLIKKMAKDEGYQLIELIKESVPAYKGRKIQMDLRIYIFRQE